MLKKQIYKYTVIFEPAEEGGYIVFVPALPGCVTQGETFEDAQIMVKDAIDGYISILEEENKEIPIEKQGVTISKVYTEIPLKAKCIAS